MVLNNYVHIILHYSSDMDECSDNTDNCSQHCNNTVGSYTCYCDNGYTLNITDGHTCDGKSFIYILI